MVNNIAYTFGRRAGSAPTLSNRLTVSLIAVGKRKNEVPPSSVRRVVRFINLEEGWVEIDHEEIKDLMPPMQMEWSVKDRSLLKSVRVGDKVDFTVVETGGGEVLTELKRATQEGRP